MGQTQTKPSEVWDAESNMNEQYDRVEQDLDRLRAGYEAKMDDALKDDSEWEEL